MGKFIIAKSNRGTPELIGLHNEVGDIINPSTEDKQDDQVTLLEQIEQNTSDIDINLDTLVIEAEEINLNTDNLESLQQETVDAIGQASGTNIIIRLGDIWDKLVELFNTGVAKLKIWDGTNTAGVTTDSKLKVETSSEVAKTEGYNISDIDKTGDPVYYGMTRFDGKYYIIQRTKSTGTWRYTKGDSDYTTAWANKTSESYDYYFNTF